MKIEYTKCDICGKKIDGRHTGKYLCTLTGSLDCWEPDAKLNPPSTMDFCYKCLSKLTAIINSNSAIPVIRY